VNTEVILREYSQAEGGEDGAVDSDAQVAKSPAKNGSNDFVGTEFREVAVGNPEWERDKETNEDREGDDRIATTRCVKPVAKSSPRDGVTVERLNLLTGPDVAALHVKKDLAMGRNDNLHDNVVQQSTNDGAHALHCESDTRRELGVLSHLKIANQTTSLIEGVEAVERKVHVGLRISGDHSSAKHLHQAANVRDETSDGVDGDNEWQEDS